MCTSPAWSRWAQTASGCADRVVSDPARPFLYMADRSSRRRRERWRGRLWSLSDYARSRAGTFPITTPGVAAEGVGRFTLSDMDLFMAGVWRVELRVSAGDLTDTIRFHFALDS